MYFLCKDEMFSSRQGEATEEVRIALQSTIRYIAVVRLPKLAVSKLPKEILHLEH